MGFEQSWPRPRPPTRRAHDCLGARARVVRLFEYFWPEEGQGLFGLAVGAGNPEDIGFARVIGGARGDEEPI